MTCLIQIATFLKCMRTKIRFTVRQALETTVQNHWKHHVCLRPVLCITCHCSYKCCWQCCSPAHCWRLEILGVFFLLLPNHVPPSLLSEIVSLSCDSAYMANSVSGALQSSLSSQCQEQCQLYTSTCPVQSLAKVKPSPKVITQEYRPSMYEEHESMCEIRTY